jgi:hypothetical protein
LTVAAPAADHIDAVVQAGKTAAAELQADLADRVRLREQKVAYVTHMLAVAARL